MTIKWSFSYISYVRFYVQEDSGEDTYKLLACSQILILYILCFLNVCNKFMK